MIVVYAIVFNDKYRLQAWYNHYSLFADKLVVYDNESDDGTAELAKELGCEVRTFQTGGKLNDDAYLEIKNNCWKELQSDNRAVAIVVDIDELVWSGGIRERLLAMDTPLIQCTGFNMVARERPEIKDGLLLMDKIRSGQKEKNYSKACILKPSRLKSLDYAIGAHGFTAIGINGKEYSTMPNPNYKLLHYKMIGFEETKEQNLEIYGKRMSEANIKQGHGIHYLYPVERFKHEFDELEKAAFDVFNKAAYL